MISRVPAELNLQVFTAQNEVRGGYRGSLRAGARLGGLLAKAKAACRHGEFLNWLEKHFEGSARHAQRLMLLAKIYPDPETIPALLINAVLRLIAGKEATQRTLLAQDGLSDETGTVMLTALPEVME